MGQPGTNIGSIKVDNRVDVAGVFQCGINRQKEPISKMSHSNFLMMLLTIIMLKYCTSLQSFVAFIQLLSEAKKYA
jgi:hypothetical protein